MNSEANMFKNKITHYFNLPIALCILSIALLSACSEKQSSNNPSLVSLIQQGKAYKEQYQYKATMAVAQNAIKLYPEQIDGYLLLAASYSDIGSMRDAIHLLENYQYAKNEQYYFQLLENYIDIGKHISALTLLRANPDIFKKQPNRLLIAEGKLALSKENIREAFSYFNQIDKQDEYYFESQIGIAKIEMIDGDFNTAMKTLDAVLAIDKDHIETLKLKSYIYTTQKQYEKAETTLTHILPLLPASDIFTPQRISVLEAIIQVLTLQGRSAEATLYTQILSTEMPEFASANQRYAQALKAFKNKEVEKSKSILNEILTDTPGYTKATTLLGVILYGEGNITEAEQYLSKVIDPETNTKELTQLYLVSQIKLNKSSELLTMLDDLITPDTDFDTLALYSIAALDQKQMDKAKMALELMQNRQPDSSQLAFLQNRYYTSLEQPDYDQANQILTRALTLDESNLTLQKAYIGNLLLDGKMADADSYINNLNARKNKNIEQSLLIAQYNLYRKDYKQAESQLSQIRQTAPEHLDSLYTLAKVYQVQQQWGSALTVFQQIIKYHPDLVNGYQGTIASMLKQGKKPTFKTIPLPEESNNAVLNLVYSNYLLLSKQYQAAHDLLNKDMSLLPAQLQPQKKELQKQVNIKRAISALAKKDYQQSRVIAVENIKKSPDDAVFYNILAKTEIEAQQFSEAKKVIEQITARFPKNQTLDVIKADLSLAKGDTQEAIRLFKQAWSNSKEDATAAKLYATLMRNNKDQAPAFLTEWLIALPDSLAANLSKAMELQQDQQHTQAINTYEKILKVAPNNLISLNNAAWLYIDHDIDKAEALAQKAYSLAPSNPSILDTYGWILFKNGKKDEAKDMIKSALTILPDDVNIQSHWIDVQN